MCYSRADNDISLRQLLVQLMSCVLLLLSILICGIPVYVVYQQDDVDNSDMLCLGCNSDAGVPPVPFRFSIKYGVVWFDFGGSLCLLNLPWAVFGLHLLLFRK